MQEDISSSKTGNNQVNRVYFKDYINNCAENLSETIFGNWEPFKIEEKWFLFDFLISFRPQDILIFVLTFWSWWKTARLEIWD